MPVALLLSAVLVLIAVLSIRSQFRQLREVRHGPAMASDDRSYLRHRSIRRIINGGLMLALGGMLAGSYLSGNEDRADGIAAEAEQAKRDGVARDRTEEEKAFLRFYGGYWIGVLVLLFLVMAVAVADFWATRRYAMAQLNRLREDHQAVLRRDLEMYRQQKRSDRMRPGGGR